MLSLRIAKLHWYNTKGTSVIQIFSLIIKTSFSSEKYQQILPPLEAILNDLNWLDLKAFVL